MKRLFLSLVAVFLLFGPLVLHETQRSPSGQRIRAVCVPVLTRVADTVPTDPSVLADPLVVVCRALAAPQTNDPYDTAIVVVITVAAVLAALGLLTGTYRDDWDARNIGMLWFFVGVAVLFGRALAVRWGWTTGTAPSAEPINDFARACLIVGGVVFVWARVDWMRYRWRARHA